MENQIEQENNNLDSGSRHNKKTIIAIVLIVFLLGIFAATYLYFNGGIVDSDVDKYGGVISDAKKGLDGKKGLGEKNDRKVYTGIVFEDHEKLINFIESEKANRNFDFFFNSVFISGNLEKRILEDFKSVDEFKKLFEEKINNRIRGRKLKSIHYINKVDQDKIDKGVVARNYYAVYESGNMITNYHWFVKKENGWFLDFDKEYDSLIWQYFPDIREKNEKDIEKKEIEYIKREVERLRDRTDVSGIDKVDFAMVKDVVSNHENEIISVIEVMDTNRKEEKKELRELYVQMESGILTEQEVMKKSYEMEELNKKPFYNLFSRESLPVVKSSEMFREAFSIFNMQTIKGGLYSRMLESPNIDENEDNLPFVVTNDNRIRFYMYSEFIPYDLIYEDGEWKIDIEISLKHIIYVQDGEERLEHIQGISNSHYAAYGLLELIKELNNFKKDYGYYPSDIMDLFPDYYIYKYSLPGFLYSSDLEDEPNNVHVAVIVSFNEVDQLLEVDSDFNSVDIFFNGFNGSDENITYNESGKYPKVRIDFTSDNFSKLVQYFDNLYLNENTKNTVYEEKIKPDKTVLKNVNLLQSGLEMFFMNNKRYPTIDELDGGWGLIAKKYIYALPINPYSKNGKFQYLQTYNGEKYEIHYVIKEDISGVEKGSYIACQSGYECEYVNEENNEVVTQDNDSDGDGLPNYDEVLFGTNIDVADSDGDGYSDYEEIINGYDPNSPEGAVTIISSKEAGIVVSKFYNENVHSMKEVEYVIKNISEEIGLYKVEIRDSENNERTSYLTRDGKLIFMIKEETNIDKGVLSLEDAKDEIDKYLKSKYGDLIEVKDVEAYNVLYRYTVYDGNRNIYSYSTKDCKNVFLTGSNTTK